MTTEDEIWRQLRESEQRLRESVSASIMRREAEDAMAVPREDFEVQDAWYRDHFSPGMAGPWCEAWKLEFVPEHGEYVMMDDRGTCLHESCWMIYMQLDELQRCTRHPESALIPVEAGSGKGFAGGNVYWTNYACGCMDMDESDDVRAAY
jgi:hypothetical protein